MSDVKKVNGYLIKEIQPGEWWILGNTEEQVAGAFATEAAAIEVAAVLQDLPPSPVRKRNKSS